MDWQSAFSILVDIALFYPLFVLDFWVSVILRYMQYVFMAVAVIAAPVESWSFYALMEHDKLNKRKNQAYSKAQWLSLVDMFVVE